MTYYANWGGKQWPSTVTGSILEKAFGPDMPESTGPSSSPTNEMRDQTQENLEHGGNPSRSSIVHEGSWGSTAVSRSPASLQTRGAKETAGDDVLALVPTKPGNASPKNGDVESGAEYKEEDDGISPRNASHAEGTVIENPPQNEVDYATMSWWHTALGKQHPSTLPDTPPHI
ncbi:hypothetical protein KC340_g18541 [Hortaea werneckii]|nr:hypothetical protein KC339_g18459 [Hortaea werneckii]KAI7283574.1 hypothetical protein KC340_g18541 [Hortaea werneckii]